MTDTQRFPGGGEILCWVRSHGGERLVVAVNFATAPAPLRLPDELADATALVLSSDPDRAADGGAITLAPGEGVLLR